MRPETGPWLCKRGHDKNVTGVDTRRTCRVCASGRVRRCSVPSYRAWLREWHRAYDQTPTRKRYLRNRRRQETYRAANRVYQQRCRSRRQLQSVVVQTA